MKGEWLGAGEYCGESLGATFGHRLVFSDHWNSELLRFPASQKGRDYPGIATTERSRREIWPSVALVRELSEDADGIENLCGYPVCRVGDIVGYVFPDFADIFVRFWVERMAAHAERRRLRWTSVFSIRRRKASSPSMGVTIPLSRSS